MVSPRCWTSRARGSWPSWSSARTRRARPGAAAAGRRCIIPPAGGGGSGDARVAGPRPAGALLRDHRPVRGRGPLRGLDLPVLSRALDAGGGADALLLAGAAAGVRAVAGGLEGAAGAPVVVRAPDPGGDDLALPGRDDGEPAADAGLGAAGASLGPDRDGLRHA